MTWAVDFGWNTDSSYQFDSHLFFIFFFQSSFNFFISFFPNQWKDCQKPFFLSNKHFLLLESLPRTSMPTLKKYVEPRLRCEFDSFHTFQLRLGTKKRPSANNYPRLLGNEQETQMLKSKGVKIQFNFLAWGHTRVINVWQTVHIVSTALRLKLRMLLLPNAVLWLVRSMEKSNAPDLSS